MAIEFNTIRYKNLLSVGNHFIEIPLKTNDSTLLIGRNGSGKSAILDALCFGLYGKPFRNIKKDQLINSVNRKTTLVEIEFTINGIEYLVRRGMKPNVFEIHHNGKMLDQSASSRDYQEILEKNILRIDFKSFCQIVILGSASFVPFMQLTPAVRREVIENLLDIRIFSSMQVLLKDRVASAQKQYDITDRDMALTKESIKIQHDIENENKERNDTKITEFKDKINIINLKLVDINSQIDLNQSAIDRLINDIADHNSVIANQQKIIQLETSLEAKRNDARKTVSFYNTNDVCPTCTQPIDIDFKNTKIATHTTKITDLNQALKDLSGTFSKTESRLSEIMIVQKNIADKQRIGNRLMADVASSQKEISVWQQQIDNASKEATTSLNQDALDKLNEKYATLLTSRQKTLELYEIYNLASVILRDGGIKSRIIKQYIPVINTLVNKYLAAMDFFVKFQLDENFNETILSRHRDTFTYESFSEGEKMRIDLALLFAWRSIAKLKNSADTNLLILDEVLDASLDIDGCDEFLKLIKNLADTSIYVISHKGDALQDKFSNVIRFEKHKNFTRII